MGGYLGEKEMTELETCLIMDAIAELEFGRVADRALAVHLTELYAVRDEAIYRHVWDGLTEYIGRHARTHPNFTTFLQM